MYSFYSAHPDQAAYGPKRLSSQPPRISVVRIAIAIAVAIAVVAAIAAITSGAEHIPQWRAPTADDAAQILGFMQISLGIVVLSIILPARIGLVLLLTGSTGFFACLAVALTYGIRF